MSRRVGPRSTDPLFAKVHAHPHDDAHRHVLADRLIELGDPRGEFIALQLARGDGKPTARERSLLRKHREAWGGPLTKVMNERYTRWARGFLDDVSVELPSVIVGGGEMWSTVRRLQLFGDWHDAHAEFRAGSFRSLAILRGNVTLRDAAILLGAKPRPPLEELQLNTSGVSPVNRKKIVDRLIGFERLTDLAIDVKEYPWTAAGLRWLFESPIAKRLRRLCLGVEGALDLAGVLRVAAPLVQLEELVVGHSYFDCRFRRGAGGALTELHVTWSGITSAASYLTQVAAPLRALAPGALTKFEFSSGSSRFNAKQLSAVRNAADRALGRA